jgi:glutamate formiminotransferase/formiminotetrahydrofolate cyclodeaminase
MGKLFELVPNISEGRDRVIIDRCAEAIAQTSGARLLETDPSEDANRTVFTVLGDAASIEEAALALAKTARELIDMREHSGAHPRIGALDVCPVVPLKNATTDDAVRLARRIGERIGEEENAPVYLYGDAARDERRRRLADVRKGEYESLEREIAKPDRLPDYGPASFDPKFGAVAVGARKLLLAFNVNLNARKVAFARDIALDVRERGRPARRENLHTPLYSQRGPILRYRTGAYPCGQCGYVGRSIEQTIAHAREKHMVDLERALRLAGVDPNKPEGAAARKPGSLKATMALGWALPSRGVTQVSMNLLDLDVVSPGLAMETVRVKARDRGVVVTGAEIVGMVPRDVLTDVGRYYLRRQGDRDEASDEEAIVVAVHSLGLNDLYPFRVEKKTFTY